MELFFCNHVTDLCCNHGHCYFVGKHCPNLNALNFVCTGKIDKFHPLLSSDHLDNDIDQTLKSCLFNFFSEQGAQPVGLLGVDGS